MSRPRKTGTTPISFRLPTAQVPRIDAAAEAAGLSRSRYLRWRFKDLEPPSDPALAALARVIAIHELVAADPACAAGIVAELRQLVIDLSMHAIQVPQ